MASSFSVSSQVSQKYDVFLNFRGENVRFNFLSYLIAALNQASLNIFVDYKLKRGEHIKSALMDAIQDSKVSLTIFSEGYASSAWSLDELVKVMECRENPMLRQKVIPVFYHVTASDVRNQSGVFAEDFAKHESHCGSRSKVPLWRAAMAAAGCLSGRSVKKTSPEVDVLMQIVNDVLEILGKNDPISNTGDNICKRTFSLASMHAEVHIFLYNQKEISLGKLKDCPIIQQQQGNGPTWTISKRQVLHAKDLNTLLRSIEVQARGKPSESHSNQSETSSTHPSSPISYHSGRNDPILNNGDNISKRTFSFASLHAELRIFLYNQKEISSGKLKDCPSIQQQQGNGSIWTISKCQVLHAKDLNTLLKSIEVQVGGKPSRSHSNQAGTSSTYPSPPISYHSEISSGKLKDCPNIQQQQGNGSIWAVSKRQVLHAKDLNTILKSIEVQAGGKPSESQSNLSKTSSSHPSPQITYRSEISSGKLKECPNIQQQQRNGSIWTISKQQVRHAKDLNTLLRSIEVQTEGKPSESHSNQSETLSTHPSPPISYHSEISLGKLKDCPNIQQQQGNDSIWTISKRQVLHAKDLNTLLKSIEVQAGWKPSESHSNQSRTSSTHPSPPIL